MKTARAWGLSIMLSCAGLATLLLLLVPSDALAVPGQAGVKSVVWPIAPTVAVLGVPAALSRAFDDLERTATHRHRRRVYIMLLWAALSFAGCAAGASFDLVIVARNWMTMYGIALAATGLVSASLAWIPLCFLPISMWLMGTHIDQSVSAWAVLLQPRSSTASLLASILAVGLGAGVFLGQRAPLAGRMAVRRRRI